MEDLLEEEVTELFIDVSEYEHPEPFEKVIQILQSMKKGQYIRMHHRKKPLPLLQLLQQQGFDFRIYQRADIPWEIIIWYKKNIDVAQYCLRRFAE